MTEWIRPKGCEGGACVEYRVVDGKVFVRNSADLTDNGMLEFTAAEWDTFVAGLTSPIASARDLWRDKHAAVVEQVEAAEAAAKRVIDSFEAMSKTRESFAAENATLTAELAGAHAIAQRANARADTLAADLSRVRTQLATANDRFAETLRQRDVAIAEAAVLRHRDRRTQAVVEAAVALHAGFAARKPGGGSAELCGLTAAVDALLEAKLCICRPRHREDDPICQYVPVAPQTGLSATESADQPLVEGTATDGLEAQGGAQRGGGLSWPDPICPDCDVSDHGGCLGECGCSCAGRLRRRPRLAGSTCLDCRVALDPKVGWHFCTPKSSPRVWNAGDPEPEGVEKVRDSTGDVWTLLGSGELWGMGTAWNEGRWRRSRWSKLVEQWGPLTEVLPEPAAPTAADLQAARDQTRADATAMLATGGIIPPGTRFAVEPDPVEHWVPLTAKAHRIASLIDTKLGAVTKPAGEVPEAGRAGEAQTKDQDRTEGLDAAIEAAVTAARFEVGDRIWPAGVKLAASDVNAAIEERIRIGIRAASPLIERAALHAAAHEAHLCDDCQINIRARATRTETS